MSSLDEDGDLEEQPFLGERSNHEKRTDQQRRASWGISSLVLLVVFVFAMSSALTAVSIGLSNSSVGLADQGHESPQPVSPSEPQPTSPPANIVIQEDIPSTPRLRTSDEYILAPTWDFQAPPTTREYSWTIDGAILNPDGVFRPMVLINNQFPGPLVEVNEGDTLVVHVSNQGVNATSVHFHGIFQNGTNNMDGTVGVTQCPIAPGSNFTYRFTVAGQAGTYWYHAHHSAQANDGLLGPMVVHARNEKTELQKLEYATDRVVMVQDFYHNTAAELLMDYLRPGRENQEPIPDSALINGRGIRDCSDFPGWECDSSALGLQPFDLQRGQRHRLRFINVGAFAEFQIEMDEHPFYITEVDSTDVHPEPFHRLNVMPAQRYSIVLEANATNADSFWLRARMLRHCFRGPENPHMKEDIRAVIRYVDGEQKPTSNTPVPSPSSKAWSETIELVCRDLNTSALHPVLAQDAPPSDGYVHLRASFGIGDWRLARGFFNDSTWHANATSPTLHRFLDAAATNTSSAQPPDLPFGINIRDFDPAHDLVLQTRGILTLDIAINNFDDGAHPFHLHGHQFYILTPSLTGYPPSAADLPGFLAARGALRNPLRRDTVTVEGYQWVIVRVVLDNPGFWVLHCHNAWHTEAGMVMQLLVRGEVVRKGRVGEEEREMCRREGVGRGARPEDEIWFGQFED
ncbi:Cupredoxin [Staphylotrichum tortipilum]|uniref:Cupredoxin n=1 Tax=Staphylotrichum tortipilum TaxID=2831512 RepID=A0AAN6MKD6_9PEZI|nr:Cupredoxin [Staphylotrichum longicolle]